MAGKLQLIDHWHCIATPRSMDEVPALLAQAPAHAAFEFDTYRILSRAIAQGKLEVRQLS